MTAPYVRHPEILQSGAERLQAASREVAPEELQSERLGTIIARMSRILTETTDGVALAAPQIGEMIRLFVVSRRRLAQEDLPDLVFINPRIVKRSRHRILVHEGCLSVAGVYRETRRAEKVTIEALDERGEKITRGATGVLAQIFQHEIDHLDGLLFIDTAHG